MTETLQGRAANEEAVTFTMQDPPPSVVEDAVVTLVGVSGSYFFE